MNQPAPSLARGPWLFPFLALSRSWQRLWFTPAPALDVAVARLLLFLWIWYNYKSFNFSAYYPLVEGGLFRPVSFFKAWDLVPSLAVLEAAHTLWTVALLGAALGAFTRWSMLVSGLGLLYIGGFIQNFGKYTGGGIDVVVLLTLVFSLSRAGDYLSVDQFVAKHREGLRGSTLARAWRSPPPDSAEYRWPIAAGWLLLFCMYFTAGWAKVEASGFGWGLGDNMRNLFIRHHYSHQQWNELGLWIAEIPWLYQLFGVMTIVFEFFCPLGLLHPSLRYFFGFGLLGLQFGIWLLLGITFRPVQVFAIFLLPWSGIIALLQRTHQQLLGRRSAPVANETE